MKDVSVTIRRDAVAELPMRNILGMNNSPRTYGRNTKAEKQMYDGLKLKYVRYHDAAKENPAWQNIDISRIFPLFHLDENDPQNYFFGQTDDYLSILKDDPVEIDFRLGECIDNSGFGRLIHVPADAEKWARICCNIVSHYKNGLWNGMHLNINRVTVWEEPDNPALLLGDVEQYTELFCSVWRLFRRELPDVKVGGPTSMPHTQDFLRRFLEICREQGTPPDFLTHTIYSRTVEKITNMVRSNRQLLDSFGFTDTTDTLAEWHLGSAPASPQIKDRTRVDGFRETINAAFSAATLTELMDIPYLDVAYYYSWAIGRFAAFDVSDAQRTLFPVYYGLQYFQKLAVERPERLAVEADKTDNMYLLAGKTAAGTQRLLISCYESESFSIHVHAEAARCRLFSIDSLFDRASATEGNVLEADAEGVYSLFHPAGNAVYLLEFSAE